MSLLTCVAPAPDGGGPDAPLVPGGKTDHPALGSVCLNEDGSLEDLGLEDGTDLGFRYEPPDEEDGEGGRGRCVDDDGNRRRIRQLPQRQPGQCVHGLRLHGSRRPARRPVRRHVVGEHQDVRSRPARRQDGLAVWLQVHAHVRPGRATAWSSRPTTRPRAAIPTRCTWATATIASASPRPSRAQQRPWPRAIFSDSQHWKFAPSEGGSFRLVNDDTALCLEVEGGSTDEGAAIVQAACTGGDRQRWLIGLVGDDVMLINKRSNHCVEVGSADEVEQRVCDPDAAQVWTRLLRL